MNIGVVVVTHNRLEKLKKCLKAYDEQTYQPMFILIVDNCSTDGTAKYLKEWQGCSSASTYQRYVIRNSINTGGAGGFALGIESALSLNADWIWLGDDDAYPEADCLLQIADFYKKLPYDEVSKIAAVCGKVVDNNGISSPHRRILCKKKLQVREIPLNGTEYLAPWINIDLFSFVGTAIRKDIICQIGLPREDYFIFYDDSEYSLRIREKWEIKCIPSAVILHDSLENAPLQYTWKNYYMFRNKMYTYKIYFSRWYYFVEQLKTIYMIFKHYNKLSSWQQFYYAWNDARKEKLGKCTKYMP